LYIDDIAIDEYIPLSRLFITQVFWIETGFITPFPLLPIIVESVMTPPFTAVLLESPMYEAVIMDAPLTPPPFMDIVLFIMLDAPETAVP
jgi:hypothetical protein